MGKGSMSTGAGIRVGADVVGVRQVAESIAKFGDRYLRRVYTEHEIASCIGAPMVVAAGLAARFAAKEATIKVLRPSGHQPAWRCIEVHRHAAGWCSISLSGHAAFLAEQAGIAEIGLSLTHEADMGAAVVVAMCHEAEPKCEERGSHIGGLSFIGAGSWTK